MKALYLNISQSISVPTENIIGIFDMDNSTVSPDTRSFLRISQSEKRLLSDVRDIPKSFVVTSDKVYLSQLSSHTLVGRGERNN
ncbi:MAG: DUF370 domain-containing protein [Ruminococcaceae bacterium]|nr:DUF370 domain-containing protein [Oscillospiraceae bacterium]